MIFLRAHNFRAPKFPSIVARVKFIILVTLTNVAVANTPSSLAGYCKKNIMNALQYKIAKAKYQEQVSLARSQIASVLPSANLIAAHNWAVSSFEPRDSQSDSNIQRLRLNFSQPLFRPDSWEDYVSSDFSSQLAKIQYQSAYQTIFQGCMVSAFNVSSTREAKAHMSSILATATERLRIANVYHLAGELSTLDAQKHASDFDALKTRYTEAHAAHIIALDEFSTATGGSPAVDRYTHMPTAYAADHLPKLDDWIRIAGQHNLLVREKEIELKLAESKVIRRAAEHFPSVDLVGSINLLPPPEKKSQRHNGYDPSTVSIQLTIPLYAGGRTQHGLSAEGYRKERSIVELDEARLAVNSSMRRLWLSVAEASTATVHLASASALALKNLQANELGITRNSLAKIALMDAQINAIEAKKLHDQSIYQLRTFTFLLHSHAGLWDYYLPD